MPLWSYKNIDMAMQLIHQAVFDSHQLLVDGVEQYAVAHRVNDLRAFQKAVYRAMDLQYSKFHKMDLFCRQGFLACEALMREVESPTKGDSVGLFLVNRYSSIDTDERFYESYANGGLASPSLFVYTLPNILIGELAIRHRITGEHAFFIQSDFGAEFIYLYIQALFASGSIRQAIIGTCSMTDWYTKAKMGWLDSNIDETIEPFDFKAYNDWMNT